MLGVAQRLPNRCIHFEGSVEFLVNELYSDFLHMSEIYIDLTIVIFVNYVWLFPMYLKITRYYALRQIH